MISNEEIASRIDSLIEVRQKMGRKNNLTLQRAANYVRILSFSLYRAYIDNGKRLPQEVRKAVKGAWLDVDYAIEHADGAEIFKESAVSRDSYRNRLVAGIRNPHHLESEGARDETISLRRDLTRTFKY